ncbi:MAG: diguanylate cyclase [Yoonia sp.]|uniref:diguanylate cyclase n=1 Tax=Yoonia sp. TaxID=2212373 RepID=UPI003EF14ACE
MLTTDDTADTAAHFLDIGADDVVAQAVTTQELVLRATALLARKHQHDKLRTMVHDGLNAALTDPLTGLYNRRYLDPHLARMAEQAEKSGRCFAVMMIDIDHFKAINDGYGHAAGDQVLVQLADRLRENLRAIDLVARVGGEEFLVAMPRASARQARLAADRLRRMVNNRPFDVDTDVAPVAVTVPVGVAVS